MYQKQVLLSLCLLFTTFLFAQDSVWVRLRPKYNDVGKIHRLMFGENYRKEWSDSTLLPIIRLSTIEGGLTATRLGGGHQTVSLRMKSAAGNEWVLRNIEKDASVLLPPELRQTFAREVIDDAMSAQHPFSPLVVAVLAAAVNVPHANPIIGIIRGEGQLGEYEKHFEGRVCLLEEREPLGRSENTPRVFRYLDEDNDNTIDGDAFLRARLLDILIGDWDRHPDQWRWVDVKKGKNKHFVGIPRDRDQAFYLNEGLFPRLASRPWFVPSLQGFRGDIWFPKYAIKESSFMQSRYTTNLSSEKWMQITKEFCAKLTDDVLRSALSQLPAAAHKRRHQQLFEALKERRDNLPAAMAEYYRFVNRIVELQLSHKNEYVKVEGLRGDSARLVIKKIARTGVNETLFTQVYNFPGTRELRIYTGGGRDSVQIDAPENKIRIRLIGGDGQKHYSINSKKVVRIYENDSSSEHIQGKSFRAFLSPDSSNIAYIPANRYNIVKPLVAAGFNRDDGFLIGLGIQLTHQGFRKVPYAGLNRLMAHYSFATSAFRIRYSGEFIHAAGHADVVTQADIYAPENTHNFFGTGNETEFNKINNSITFYRTRFSLFNFSAGLRWRNEKGGSIIIAPAFQHYRFDSADNRGRILNYPQLVFSYDSISIPRRKSHGGLLINLAINRVNNRIIPTSGYFVTLQMQALGGLNRFSKSFAQFLPELGIYLPLNRKKSIILAERLGAGFTVGKAAFYQSVFAGGQGNLQGYRQYRFAGEQMLYHNLELRAKLASFTGYIIPGEFGAIAFYDVGRVWTKDEHSKAWHQGTGGGLYFAPAKMALISLVAGYSKEGWYPYITFGFRF